MLKFYWPFSVMILLFGSFFGVNLSTLFAVGIVAEIIIVFIIISKLRQSTDIASFSIVGILASQYDLGEEFQLSDLIGESAIRIIALGLGAMSFLWYIPTILGLLWSTLKITEIE